MDGSVTGPQGDDRTRPWTPEARLLSLPLWTHHWEASASPLGGAEVFLPVLEDDAIRILLDALVDEVEDVGLWPAVQLGLDLLRVRVLCELLPRFIHKEEEAVLLGVGHLELLGAKLTHVFSGDVRPHEEGLSRAATVDLLECNPEVILRGAEERDSGWDRVRRGTEMAQINPWDAKERNRR